MLILRTIQLQPRHYSPNPNDMKTTKMLLGTIVVAAIASCSSNEPDEPTIGRNDIKEMAMTYACSDKVGNEEIARIAERFSAKGEDLRTRSGEPGYKVSTVYADDGTPAIYVVNYDQENGFVLVSATKNMFPVLAYSNEGNFSMLGEKPEGLKNWLNETRAAVANAGNLPADSILKNRAHWIPYENTTTADSPTRVAGYSSMSEDEHQQALSVLYAKMNELERQGYEIRSIDREITGDPARDEQIRNLVSGAIYPSYQEAWIELSFAAYKSIEKRDTVNNFVLSKWNQSFGYNQSFPLVGGQLAVVGCGPVAVGQIMRYFEHPALFSWQDMPYEMPTKITSDFLYDVALKSKAEFKDGETGTSKDNLKDALNGYGYKTNMANHNAYAEWESIKDRRPILMRGRTKEGKAGHFWVCSGGDYSSGNSQWEIYTFTASLHMDCVHTYEYGHYVYHYFYMNWGWGGNCDGFYYSQEMNPPGVGPFNKERVNIYISK